MAADVDRCAELREEELVALSSIYENSFLQISESSFEIQIVCDEDSWWSMTVRITLPMFYPQMERPVYDVFGECLTDDDLLKIGNGMDEVWNEYKGECMLFVWIEKCKNILLERKDSCSQFNEDSSNRHSKGNGIGYEYIVSNDKDSHTLIILYFIILHYIILYYIILYYIILYYIILDIFYFMYLLEN